MPDADIQVVFQDSSNLSKDRYVNTLHFSSSTAESWSSFVAGIADDIAGAYSPLAVYMSNTVISRFEVRCYNPDDPKPRQPYTYVGALPTRGSSASPSEVALCLSYYADRNLPRQRGRIYFGPISGVHISAARPSTELQDALCDFAEAMSGIGGLNVDWQHVSTVTGERKRITNVWVDNAWDTQRRRGLSPTSRMTRAVSG